MKSIRRILIATDFSKGANAAARLAAEWARRLKASVDVVTVVDTLPLVEAYGDASYRKERAAEIREDARRRVEKFAVDGFSGCGRVRAYVRDGYTSSEIMAAACELDSDLIVMGTHGRTGIAHLVIGSVAEKVVRKSPVPVLTVRAK
ncbi:MAG: universal stress protein [Deltaproteobacteria bacterium]|nr:universal stress protein [Deltaproteobacteria bacterium]